MSILNILVILAGLIASPLLVISYVPQIIQIKKTKNVEGINLSFWYILDASLLCFVILALDSYLKTGQWVLLVSQFLNLIFALIVTFQVLFYRKTK